MFLIFKSVDESDVAIKVSLIKTIQTQWVKDVHKDGEPEINVTAINPDSPNPIYLLDPFEAVVERVNNVLAASISKKE